MKKVFILVALIFLMVTLTACEETTESYRTEIEAVVVCSEEGDFVLNPAYTALATQAMASGNTTKYILYNNLAKSTGTQKYNITVKIGEETFEVVRNEEYKENDAITIIRVDTYQGEELITTEYE